MQPWSSRGYCWFQLIKVFRWLESLSPSRISSNMQHYIDAELANLHFMYVVAHENAHMKLNIQRFSRFSKDISPLCILFLFPLQEFCYIFQCPYHTSRHKIIHSRTASNEDTQMFGDSADFYLEIVLLHPLNNCSIFFTQPQTWNAYRQASHWCNEACWSIDDWWEWRFKPVKYFYLPNLTASSTILTLHFRTHIPTGNVLAKFPSIAFIFHTYNFEIPCIKKKNCTTNVEYFTVF